MGYFDSILKTGKRQRPNRAARRAAEQRRARERRRATRAAARKEG